MPDNDDGDDNIVKLPSSLDRIGGGNPVGEQLYDPGSKNYKASWAPPGDKSRNPETVAFFWNKAGNLAWLIPYHAMKKLQFNNGDITFFYEGDKFTLKGFNLQKLFIDMGLKKSQQLREYNPDYHTNIKKEELIALGESCIEELIVEEG